MTRRSKGMPMWSLVLKRNSRKKPRGQATVEYVLMIAFGAVFAIKITQFFNGIFTEGLAKLETNVQSEMATGQGFNR
jgi:hypothetical protein